MLARALVASFVLMGCSPEVEHIDPNLDLKTELNWFRGFEEGQACALAKLLEEPRLAVSPMGASMECYREDNIYKWHRPEATDEI